MPGLGRHATVAIVGRPNVGKSTLFNKLAGRRKAIVHDLPGITRDRVMADVDLEGAAVTLVDTGGFDSTADDVIRRGVREQVERAVRESDVILLVLDARAGATAQDLDVAERLRKSGRQVVLVGNKVDVTGEDARARMLADLHALGFPDVLAVSAEHRLGIDELRARVRALLPAEVEAPLSDEASRPIAVAIVGRPNVGKSSLLNALLGDERCLVTEVPGTTRDAVDVLFETEAGERFLFIDTAGIRRKGKVDTAPEKLAVVMARKALERCDVALVVIDAGAPVGHQDAVVAGYAYELGRGMVLIANKWDLLRGDRERQKRLHEEVRDRMKFADFAPVLPVSATTGFGIERVLRAVRKVDEAAARRIPTALLNRFSMEVVRPASPTVGGRGEVKIYYMTQSGVRPPTFTLFTNPKGSDVHFSFVRFLENRLRDAFPIEGTPVRFKFVAKRPSRDGVRARARARVKVARP